MSITRLTEKQQDGILPIDDIRHCPCWLRITDGVKKEASRETKTQNRSAKSETKKSLITIQLSLDNELLFEGTIMDAEKIMNIPDNTIRSALKSRRSRDQVINMKKAGYKLKEVF
jgi:hypothetical protein